jgi:PST family polysaccharide transporter
MQKLGKNIGYLSLSQAANYLLPLVTLPYITQTIGPENYGKVEFATVSVLFFSAIVTYGFTFTATRKIAELGDRNDRVSRVYSTALHAKLLLLLLSTFGFGLLLLFVPQYGHEIRLMLFAFPYVIGWALYPDFLFQGKQNLGVVALSNLGIKSLGAILIFTLLRTADDFVLVCGINSITQILASVVTLAYGHKKYPWLKFNWQPYRLLKAYLRSGFYIFLSHFFTRVYTFGIILFLAFLLPAKELGLFAAAMKLITVGQSFLFTPVGGALYPYFAKQAKEDFALYLAQRKRFLLYMLAVSTAATLLIMLGSEFFVNLLFGAEYLEIAPTLALMSPVLIFTAISHFGMKQGMMVLKADGWNLKVVLVAGIISLILNFALIEFYGMQGAAWAKLCLEAILAFLSWYYFRKALSQGNYTSK